MIRRHSLLIATSSLTSPLERRRCRYKCTWRWVLMTNCFYLKVSVGCLESSHTTNEWPRCKSKEKWHTTWRGEWRSYHCTHCPSVSLEVSLSFMQLDRVMYLKVTIICRYIFLWFWFKTRFASTKFCDLYTEMVQGRQILMFYTTKVHNNYYS